MTIRVPQTEKRCTRCHQIKPVSEFSKRYTRSYVSACKACIAEAKRNRYDAQRAYEQHVCATYRISLADYQAMFTAQFGLCAICGKAPKNGKLQVDHCHKTNIVRELICLHCNSLLGYANDDIDVLKKAIKYLKKHDS